MKAPNKYDLAFLAWFQRHGWLIHDSWGQLDVWTNDDAYCHFRVTRGMIERLEAAGALTWFQPANDIFALHWGEPQKLRL